MSAVHSGAIRGATEAQATAGTSNSVFMTPLRVKNALQGGDAGEGGTRTVLLVKKTGIADNSATTVLTATVPNGNHGCAIRLLYMTSNGSTDSYDSNRAGESIILITRRTGITTVTTQASVVLSADAGTPTTLIRNQIATAGGEATHTVALTVVSGAEGAALTETVAIKLLIDDTGNLGSNQAIIYAEIINGADSGVTVVAA